MYLSKITIENFRCFGDGDKGFELCLKPGLTALVGENDAGKTAVVDALRFALGTTDQELNRLDDTDFHISQRPQFKEEERPGEAGKNERSIPEIRIVCKFEELNDNDIGAFVEFLTYGNKVEDKPVLFVCWTAKDTGENRRGRPYRRVEIRSGEKGDGPSFEVEARELLRATYLRPLRDAEQALSSGRGSRLSQVLLQTEKIKSADGKFDPDHDINRDYLESLNVLGIGDLANELLGKQKGVVETRGDIDKHLGTLSLNGNDLRSSIKVNGVTVSEDIRLRQLLEKLDLSINGEGRLGLGSNNLLFMACELLLLAQEREGNKLLLIEEPEAHLHSQRQLRVMKFLQDQAKEKNIQIIVTTHSPNLASAIELDNMVMVCDKRSFSLAKGETELEASDYRFLKRFLDATKANLFFARGVAIVEGDAENILLPTLAKLLGRDFTEYGVSVVNVGGVGLRRYARIFQRKDKNTQLNIPVACMTDMDVMPDCAPLIIGRLTEGDGWPEKKGRKWRAKKDIGDENALEAYRREKAAKASGQCVETFVSDEWTLEYDLALGPKDASGTFSNGLAEDVFVAACLADNDDDINLGKARFADVEAAASKAFAELKAATVSQNGCTVEEVLASKVYAKFAKKSVSKPVAAQYLAERLDAKFSNSEDLRKWLPKYLTAAIDYVTLTTEAQDNGKEATDER